MSQTFNGFGDSGINISLNNLPDNINQDISPKDIRDAVFTLWGNTMFKPLSVDGITYVGIDNKPNGGVGVAPIYLGRPGVMTSTLLSNSDIILFNNSNGNTTKVSILGGDATLRNSSPYLMTNVIDGKIDLDITNPSGSINIKSDSEGIVINGITMPNIPNVATYHDKYLKVENGVIIPGDGPGASPITLPIGSDEVIHNGEQLDTYLDNLANIFHIPPTIMDMDVTYSPNISFPNVAMHMGDTTFVELYNIGDLRVDFSVKQGSHQTLTSGVSVQTIPYFSSPTYLDTPPILSIGYTTLDSIPQNSLSVYTYRLILTDGSGAQVIKDIYLEVVMPYIVIVSDTLVTNANGMANLINSPTTNTHIDYYIRNENGFDFQVNTKVGNNDEPKYIYILMNSDYNKQAKLYYDNGIPLNTFNNSGTYNLALNRFGGQQKTFKVYSYGYEVGMSPSKTRVDSNFTLDFIN